MNFERLNDWSNVSGPDKNQQCALLKVNFWGAEKSLTGLSISGLFQQLLESEFKQVDLFKHWDLLLVWSVLSYQTPPANITEPSPQFPFYSQRRNYSHLRRNLSIFKVLPPLSYSTKRGLVFLFWRHGQPLLVEGKCRLIL